MQSHHHRQMLLAKSCTRLSAWAALLITLGASAGARAHAQATLRPAVPAPLLDLNLNGPGDLPLLSVALRDSDLNLPKGTSPRMERLLQDDIRQQQRRFVKSKAPRREAALHGLLIALVRYSYFLSDEMARDTKAASAASMRLLQQTQGQIANFARALYKSSRQEKHKAAALFHLATVEFLNPAKRTHANELLRKLVANHTLRTSQRRAAMLALNLVAAEQGQGEERQQAQRNLKRLDAQLPRRAATVVHLSLARSLSQQADYREHLRLLSRLCQQLGVQEKAQLAQSMIGIWQAAPDFTWRSIPFDSSCFMHELAMRAVLERRALAAWSANDLAAAKHDYGQLLRYAPNAGERQKVYARLAELLLVAYQDDKKPKPYQDYLIQSERVYRKTGFGLQLRQLHAELGLQEIRRYRELQEVPLASAALVARRYLDTQVYDEKGRRLKEELADAYLQAHDYKQAETLYGELGREPEAPNKKALLAKQIAAQSKIAQWSNEHSFEALAAAKGQHTAEREHLLRLYYNILQLEGNKVWHLSKQIGLLELSLGRRDKAFFMWENALKAFPREPEAERILAEMLQRAHDAKDWENLEEIAYLGLELHIVPQLPGASIHLREKLETALFEQAKLAVAAHEPAKAIKKLSVLEATYDDSARYSTYLYMLAKAYEAHHEFDKALASYDKMRQLSPQLAYYQHAVLDAAALYVGMAEPQAAIGLYEHFLATFPEVPQNAKTRTLLGRLYQALGQDVKARDAYQQVKLASLSPDERLYVREQLFRIDHKLRGDRAMASTAEQIIATPAEASPALTARALGLLARLAYEDNDARKLASLKAPAAPPSKDAGALVDSASYLSYLEAKLAAEHVVGAFKKVLTKQQPGEALAFLQQAYGQLKTNFQAACRVETAAYCAPSLQELVTVNGKLRGLADDMVVPDEDPRSRLVNYLRQDRSSLQARTLNLLSGAYTHPRLTRHILWQNGYDYHNPMSSEASPGYLQLSQGSLKTKKHGQGG